MKSYNIEEKSKEVKKLYFHYAKLKTHINEIISETSEKTINNMTNQYNKLISQAKKMSKSPFTEQFIVSTDEAYEKSISKMEAQKRINEKDLEPFQDEIYKIIAELANQDETVKNSGIKIKGIEKSILEEMLEDNRFDITEVKEHLYDKGFTIIKFSLISEEQENAFQFVKKIKEKYPEVEILENDKLIELLKFESLSSAKEKSNIKERDSVFNNYPTIIPYTSKSDVGWMMAHPEVYSDNDLEDEILKEIINEYESEYGSEFKYPEENNNENVLSM